MDVALADPAPVDELDAELEGGIGRRHERRLVDAERLVERAQMRQRRLADADDADLLRFDQLDAAAPGHALHQRRRGHPAGGAAAEHDDAGKGRACHAPLSPEGGEEASDWRGALAGWHYRKSMY
jgi:hypothetical protein